MATTKHKKSASKKSSDNTHVTIPVESYLPDNVPTFYSDGMSVLHTSNEFILSFLQTVFPLAASKEELEQLGTLRRKCVTQVIMSPAQAQAIIKTLQENMNKYIAAYRKPEAKE